MSGKIVFSFLSLFITMGVGSNRSSLFIPGSAAFADSTPCPTDPTNDCLELFQKIILSEPTVREVQKAAIRYSNLGNGRIKRWHGASRLRAFLPDLNFRKKLSRQNTIGIDRGGTNTPDFYIVGPDKIDKDGDLSLKWDLGNFVWSSAQPAIDSRSKLLVALRESIVSEITRIYFERRRIQKELLLHPPETLSREWNLFLRMEELTAHLDAVTGGYFSRQLPFLFDSRCHS